MSIFRRRAATTKATVPAVSGEPLATPALFRDDPLPGALFMDCEASGLGPRSVPVEIALSRADGRTESMLVRPTEDWLLHAQWDPQAALIHRIPQAEILAAPAVEQVVAWLDRIVLPGTHVLSDNPAFEAMWAARLYRAVGRERPFEVLDWGQLMRGLFTNRNLAQAEASAVMERVAAAYPAPHRAAPDALRMAMMARAATGISMRPAEIAPG